MQRLAAQKLHLHVIRLWTVTPLENIHLDSLTIRPAQIHA